jgi:hypothetical protein
VLFGTWRAELEGKPKDFDLKNELRYELGPSAALSEKIDIPHEQVTPTYPVSGCGPLKFSIL